MKISSKYAVIALMLLSPFSYANFDYAARVKSTVHISITAGGKTNIATGFLYNYEDGTGVITAMHAMRKNAQIKLKCDGDTVDGKISKVSWQYDLVLLTPLAPFSSCIALNEGTKDTSIQPSQTKLLGIGYRPNVITERGLELSLGFPNMKPFGHVVNDALKQKLNDIGLLDMRNSVYVVSGVTVPGNSGGPVFKLADGQLIGVISGGLDNGMSDHNWIMPIGAINSLLASNVNELPENLGLMSELFSAAETSQKEIMLTESPPPPVDSCPTCMFLPEPSQPQEQRYSWTNTKQRNFYQIKSTSAPEIGLDPLWDSIVSFSIELPIEDKQSLQQLFDFDIYAQSELGFVIAIPTGTELSQETLSDDEFIISASINEELADVIISYKNYDQADFVLQDFFYYSIEQSLRDADCDNDFIQCFIDEEEFYLVDYGEGDMVLRIGFYANQYDEQTGLVLGSSYLMISYAVTGSKTLIVDTRIDASEQSAFFQCNNGNADACGEGFVEPSAFVLANAVTALSSSVLSSTQSPTLRRFEYQCQPTLCSGQITNETESYVELVQTQDAQIEEAFYYDDAGDSVFIREGDTWWALIQGEYYSANISEQQNIDGLIYFILNDSTNLFAVPETDGMSFLWADNQWQEYKPVYRAY
jgi:hypothetical protein